MKRIDECTNMTVLVALLVVGILLVMGAYRIFSYLCENAALDARTFLLGAACLLLAVVGFLLARRSFRRLQYLRDNENRADYRQRHPGTGRDTPGTDPG